MAGDFSKLVEMNKWQKRQLTATEIMESARLAKVWHEWLEVDMDAHGWKHGDLNPLNAAADEAEVNEGRAEYITHMLRTLIAADPTLTAWEEDFLSSVTKQFDTKGRLSDKQVARLELIYAEKAE
jgi:hypothetical protein